MVCSRLRAPFDAADFEPTLVVQAMAAVLSDPMAELSVRYGAASALAHIVANRAMRHRIDAVQLTEHVSSVLKVRS